MKSLVVGALAAATGLALGAYGACAEQITLGDNTSGFALATGLGGGNLKLVIELGTTGNALFDATDTGTYSLGPVTLTAGPVNNGIFPISGSPTETFSYLGADGDKLTGTIQYKNGEIKDDSLNPDLIATLLINTVSGDALFDSTFSAGKTTGFDLTFDDLSLGMTFDALANCDGEAPCLSETANISAGEVPGNGDTIGVVEPKSLLVIGVGLIALGLLRRPQVYFGV